MRLKKPVLLRDHPNFFFSYVATVVFHVSLAYIGFFAKSSSFSSPALEYVNHFASREAWAAVSGVVASGLIVGLWRHSFALSRISLAIGASLTFTRMMLLIMPFVLHHTTLGITGLPVWALAVGVHLSQTAEPPLNPITAKRN